jgi:hypothetical protein
MRTLTLFAALALGAAPAAAQPAPADPIPLRPASVGLGVERAGPVLRVTRVVPRSPAAAAGVAPGDTLLAVDGRAASAWSPEQAQTALAGPAGAPVTLALRTRSGARAVRLARADVLAPPGASEVVVTPRFVVHHAADQEPRARAVARAAERAYARTDLPRETGGRRAHLYLARARSAAPPPLPLWAEWVSGDINLYGPSFRSSGYLAYGDPGGAAAERLAPSMVWPVNAREAHRRVAGWTPNPGVMPSGGRATPAEVAAISLREFVRARHGTRRLEALWRSPLPWDQAVPRALGVPAAALEREWRHHVTHLGPNPEAGLDGRMVSAALGWGALLLLLGFATARRREVG